MSTIWRQFYFVGVQGKKVKLKDFGNPKQSVAIYSYFREDFINIGTATTQLPSKPSNGFLLFVKFFFNMLSYINHKSANRSLNCLFTQLADQSIVCNKHETVHAQSENLSLTYSHILYKLVVY